jgi:hypothetical protein
MKTPPTQDKPEIVRLTIPVEVRVHSAFTRISKATSVPVGRCMADWMRDTIDAAEYMAEQLEGARAAPRLVAQKLHAYALGLADETGAVLAKVREQSRKGAGGGGALRAPPPTAPFPPPSNTGGKGRKHRGEST